MAIDGLERLIAEYEGGADLNRAARHVVSLAQNRITATGATTSTKALQRIDAVLNGIGTTVIALKTLEPDKVDVVYNLITAIEGGDTSKTTRSQLQELLE